MTRDAASRRESGIALAIALGLVVLLRFVLIANFGSEHPYWDQWDSEVAHLYKPWAEGTLSFADLLGAHNEHRIFFTRIADLALFAANGGRFDNLAEIHLNTILYAIALGLVAWPVFARIRGAALALATAGLVFVGAVPYAWENLVFGLQNAFFFLIAIAAAAIAATTLRDVGARRIVAIVALCLASLLTLASGVATPVVVAVLAAMRWRDGTLQRGHALALIAASVAVAALGVALVALANHATPMRATGALDFARAALHATSWPFPPGIAASLVVWSPTIAWCVVRWRDVVDGAGDERRFELYLFGIGLWSFVQAIAIAGSRGHDMTVLSSRYLDVLVPGVIANLLLATGFVRRRASPLLASFVLAIAMAAATGVATWGVKGVRFLVSRSDEVDANRARLHAYLGGARDAFDDVPPRDLPYPDVVRLRGLLDDPTIRAMMPVDAGRRETASAAERGRVSVAVGRVRDAMRRLSDRTESH